MNLDWKLVESVRKKLLPARNFSPTAQGWKWESMGSAELGFPFLGLELAVSPGIRCSLISFYSHQSSCRVELYSMFTGRSCFPLLLLKILILCLYLKWPLLIFFLNSLSGGSGEYDNSSVKCSYMLCFSVLSLGHRYCREWMYWLSFFFFILKVKPYLQKSISSAECTSVHFKGSAFHISISFILITYQESHWTLQWTVWARWEVQESSKLYCILQCCLSTHIDAQQAKHFSRAFITQKRKAVVLVFFSRLWGPLP